MKTKTAVLGELCKPQAFIVNERESCCVCGKKHLVEIMNLNKLPITGLFSKRKVSLSINGVDQRLLWCPNCGHGQLWRQIDPLVLYNSNRYIFRTSVSTRARQGVDIFLNYLRRLTHNKTFNCVFEFGCNDLYLLRKLSTIARIKVGLDPLLDSRKKASNSHIHIVGKLIEDTELDNDLPCKPDLVVCRHTLEHIYDPFYVLKKIMDYATDDAIFLFEVPSFATLLHRRYFHLIFHEHLQYFSLSSFEALLQRCGGRLLGHIENYHNWGTIIVVFRKQRTTNKKFYFPYSRKNIEHKLEIFKSQMDNTRKILYGFKDESIYGYGAALMLSVLAYHLRTDLSFLKGIIDDDVRKDGLYYANLPLKIMHVAKVKDYGESIILITAVDNVRPIIGKLLNYRPKNIIYPFHVM